MPNPAAVSDLDKFLSLLEKSTLVTAEKMADIRRTAAGHEDAKALARYLLKSGVLTKWQAMQLLAGWNAFRIDKYHLLSQVGAGEHSRMYLAEHRAMGRKVILRTLPRRSAERPEVLKRFLKEARAASQLDHRNVNHVYDVNSEGERYFVVMEYVDGRNLFEIVTENGPLTPSQAADYIRQAAEGLAYGHEKGVIHRELSPGKLVLDGQGQIKILELGITGLDEPSESASTDISGGPTSAGAYLAPEQCQAKPVADERSDIYSLGATLYFLLSGKSPVAPSAAPKPQDLLQLRSDVPGSLVELCSRMMASSPCERFATAAEVKTAVEQWLAQQRPAAPPVRRKPAPAADVAEPVVGEAPVAKPLPPKAKPKVAKPLEDSAPEVAVSDSSGFPAFDVGAAPRKGTKPASVKTKSKKTAPKPETAEDNDGEVTAKKAVPLPLIIGAAVGGVALLAVVGVVIGYMLMGGDKQVATKPADTKAEAAANAATAPTAEPAEEEEPRIAPPMPEPMPEAAAPMAEPMPEPMPAEAVPAEPMAEPAAEPKPEEPKPEEPKTEAPPKPDPKPMPKPMPKPPAIEPFAEVVKAIDLPSLGLPAKPNPMALEVVSLGKVKLEKDGIMFLRLLGGDKATDGKSTLSLANAGTDPNAWEITGTDSKMGSQVIAKLALKEGELTFQWTPEATQAPPLYAGLMNCGLDMASGPKSHRLAFRKPIEQPALPVNLERVTSKIEVEIPTAPDAAAIKFEVVKVEGIKATSDKTQLIAEKDSAFVTFGDKPTEQLIMMKIDTVMKQKLTLTLTPHFRTDTGPVKFTAKLFNAQKLAISAQQQQLYAGIEAMRKAKRPKEEIERADKQMEQLNEALKKLTDVEPILQTIASSQIQYRVYYQPAEGEQIDLVTSVAAPVAAAAELPADGAPLNLEKKE